MTFWRTLKGEGCVFIVQNICLHSALAQSSIPNHSSQAPMLTSLKKVGQNAQDREWKQSADRRTDRRTFERPLSSWFGDVQSRSLFRQRLSHLTSISLEDMDPV